MTQQIVITILIVTFLALILDAKLKQMAAKINRDNEARKEAMRVEETEPVREMYN